MKKATLTLMLLGISAILGGTFAFKTTTRLGTYYCTTNTLNPFSCDALRATVTPIGGILGRCKPSTAPSTYYCNITGFWQNS